MTPSGECFQTNGICCVDNLNVQLTHIHLTYQVNQSRFPLFYQHSFKVEWNQHKDKSPYIIKTHYGDFIYNLSKRNAYRKPPKLKHTHTSKTYKVKNVDVTSTTWTIRQTKLSRSPYNRHFIASSKECGKGDLPFQPTQALLWTSAIGSM